MAALLKQLKAWKNTPASRAAALVVYAVMLLLVLIYFTGNGEFIYEL